MGKLKLVVHETEELPKYVWNNMNMAWEYSEKHNTSLKVAVQGLDFMAHPLYIQYSEGKQA
jgi:hypothetical protein